MLVFRFYEYIKRNTRGLLGSIFVLVRNTDPKCKPTIVMLQ
jgi:hypothetical protein